VIHVESHDGIAMIRVEHGKANALDTELTRDLGSALQRLRANGTRAAVLTGTGGIFGAGVDLYRVIEGGEAYAAEFVPNLARFLKDLFEFPLPIVAAINGHAIAGGCIAACACDYRVMADGRGTIGVPELLVGVPFPAVALEIMRFAIPPQELQALVYTGRTCAPGEAARRGLVNEVVLMDQLQMRARQVAEQFASIPGTVFTATKLALRADVLERLRSDRTLDDVVRHWSSPATRAHIHQYLDRIMKKSRQEDP
jgi:enoyl-CoA hydratase